MISYIPYLVFSCDSINMFHVIYLPDNCLPYENVIKQTYYRKHGDSITEQKAAQFSFIP